jgi:putative ABC transport system permease protein
MNRARYKKPPRSAINLLKIIARPDDFYFAVGDLGQMYEAIIQEKTPLAAWCWFWWEILRSLPRFAKNSLYWSTVMFKNYLKTAGRSVRGQAGHFFINITGLAIGLACSLLIMLWVQHELSFDSFHGKADRIYRSCIDAQMGTPIKAPVTSSPMGPTMVEDFPEILESVRIYGGERIAISSGDRDFFEEDVVFADASLFEVFDFPMLRGDPSTALAAPFTTVISESAARKYFGDANPVGRTLKFRGQDEYTVTGVFRNIPSNSHLAFNVVRSFETLVASDPEFAGNWFDFSMVTYLLLEEGADYRGVERQMDAYVERHLSDLAAMGVTMKIYFQPLKDIYLKSDFGRDYGVGGNTTYVYGFSAIGLFILLIASVNFVNLTTARAARRSREVGLRKAFGADRRRLISQFLCEAIIYCVIALALAAVILEFALPFFNEIAGCRLDLNYVENPRLILGALGLAVFIGLLAGSYPAFYLSAFDASRALQQGQASTTSGSRLRSVLVVFQFAISITLIIATLTIYDQIDYMKNQELGFSGDQVLVLPDVDESITTNYDAFLNAMRRVPGVTFVSSSSRVPGRGISKTAFFPEGAPEDKPEPMNHIYADHHYLPILDIDLVQGRNFSPDVDGDAEEALLINEAAARVMGWDEPVGKIIRSPEAPPDPYSVGRVVGVIKDFHQYSLQNPIEPLVITFGGEPLATVALKLASTSIAESIAAVENVWGQFAPGRPFDYFFLDEDFEKQYHKEARLSEIVLYFCLLAISIGCLGLLGMASFAAEQRTKEIGIRKVLGASSQRMVALLARQFLGLVALANLIAWPVAYYLMGRWLENFAYHAELGLGAFVISSLLALLAALVTVSYQAIRAASTNPVNCLKHE